MFTIMMEHVSQCNDVTNFLTICGQQRMAQWNNLYKGLDTQTIFLNRIIIMCFFSLGFANTEVFYFCVYFWK